MHRRSRAIDRMESIEQAARSLLVAHLLGRVNRLSRDEVDRLMLLDPYGLESPQPRLYDHGPRAARRARGRRLALGGRADRSRVSGRVGERSARGRRRAQVTDSTAGLGPLARDLGCTVVPLALEIGGALYREDAGDVERRLLSAPRGDRFASATLPPGVEEFVRVYESLLAEHESVLSIHLSAALSQTVDRAREAARTCPQRTGSQCSIHDWRGQRSVCSAWEARARLERGAPLGEARDSDRADRGCHARLFLGLLARLPLSGWTVGARAGLRLSYRRGSAPFSPLRKDG